ncbi:MAG: F0F1 ATP synthase subunit alpha [Patescibacteria group bacterium]
MKDFNSYLNEIEEIGYVEQVADAIIYVSGLPNVKPEEIVIFETGDFGQVFSIEPELVEILIFSKNSIKPGTRLTRTNEILKVPVGVELLGKVIDSLGNSIESTKPSKSPTFTMPVNSLPQGITKRKAITKTLETGVLIVDMAIPLGHGQRELIVGDRKTGKTSFLTRTILNQTRHGNICVYAAIGKKKLDVKKIEEFFQKQGVMEKMVIVASGSEDATGLIHLTPYTAMTISEFFRDQGKDVLLVLDDLSTHAKFYRELSLLGRRFPGRNSYPSDIFYTHAKLMERAGNFITDKGEASITCLPVAETAQGDLSGYIETNLMSMTDGHLYFDKDLFYLGRRPAINPFLSVTRVGRQTQSNLRREINREIISFLNLYEKMQSFIHFGAELNENIRTTLLTGARIIQFFSQYTNEVVPINLQIVLFAMLWENSWENKELIAIREDMQRVILAYSSDKKIQQLVDTLVEQNDSFNKLLRMIKTQGPQILLSAQKYGNKT